MTNTNWFASCEDENALKALYRDLAKEHHPDLGGDTERMQEINAEYQARMNGTYTERKAETAEFWNEREGEMMEKLAELLAVPGVDVEIIGVWLWITGDTKPVKDALKEAGCRWSRDKKCWYWRSAQHKWKKRTGQTKDLDGLRQQWGSSGSVKAQGSFRLTA